MEDFKKEFEKKWGERNAGITPEISAKINIREKLCKIKKFKEAEAMQEEIDKLKEKHLENWNTKIKQKVFEDEFKNVKKKQKMEMDILYKKIKLFQDKFEVKMQNENNMITNKYNVKEKIMLNDFKRKQDKYFKYNH